MLPGRRLQVLDRVLRELRAAADIAIQVSCAGDTYIDCHHTSARRTQVAIAAGITDGSSTFGAAASVWKWVLHVDGYRRRSLSRAQGTSRAETSRGAQRGHHVAPCCSWFGPCSSAASRRSRGCACRACARRSRTASRRPAQLRERRGAPGARRAPENRRCETSAESPKLSDCSRSV